MSAWKNILSIVVVWSHLQAASASDVETCYIWSNNCTTDPNGSIAGPNVDQDLCKRALGGSHRDAAGVCIPLGHCFAARGCPYPDARILSEESYAHIFHELEAEGILKQYETTTKEECFSSLNGLSWGNEIGDADVTQQFVKECHEARVAPTDLPKRSQRTCQGAGCSHEDAQLKSSTKNRRFSFHSQGMCDLVLLANHEFKEGLGLRIHVRTSLAEVKHHSFAYVSEAVLQIGSSVVEVSPEGYYVNNVENAQLPARMDGGSLLFRYTEEIGHLERTVYKIDMGAAGVIQMLTLKNYVFVSILDANEVEFENSIGLLGDFDEGTLLARDGLTVEMDLHKFANEWQVQDTDPQLFQTKREPQYPFEACRLAKDARPHLRASASAGQEDMAAAAEQACSHRLEDKEDCIFDILSTGDIDMVIASDH